MRLIDSIAGTGIPPKVSIRRFTLAPDCGSMSSLIFSDAGEEIGIVSSLSFVEKHPDLIQRFLKGIIEGIHYGTNR